MAKAPLKYQLINPLKIRTDLSNLEFSTAKTLAENKVKSLCPDPVLVSWYDATTGDHYPDMECTAAGKPGWLDYAEVRNCDMTVDINDEQFIFVYLSQL